MILNLAFAKIYQNGVEVALMEEVSLNFRIAPIVPAPFPQPNNEVIETSGKIVSSSNFNTNNIVTIKFQVQDGKVLEGDFYFNPYKTRGRVYFELTGALIILK